MTVLTRRALLTAAIAAGLATATRFVFGGKGSVADELSEAEVASWLEEALGRSASLEKLGRTYLQQHPTESNFEELRSAVFDGRYESPLEFKEGLKTAIRDDFDRGEVVSVLGWRLSLTEIRSCALLFLTTPG